MATKLDQLLRSIDPTGTIERVASDVDDAFNEFRSDPSVIRTFDDYIDYMARFVRHMEQGILKYGGGVPYNRESYVTRYSNLINKKYGHSAWKMRYEVVQTGKQGGLYGLLKDVAALVLEDYGGREISARVWNFWNDLTNDEKIEVAEEYARKYGHLLPSEFTGGNAALLKANFPRVLEDYPRMVMDMRRSMR